VNRGLLALSASVAVLGGAYALVRAHGGEDRSGAGLAAAQEAPAPSGTVEAQPTAAADTSPPPGISSDDALRRDAESYARWQGIDLDEAVRRLRLQEEYGRTVAALREVAGDRIAGIWLQHQPDFRMVVWLKGEEPAPPPVAAVVAAAPGPVEVRLGGRFAVEELLPILDGAMRLINEEEGGSASGGVDEMANTAYVELSPYSIYAGHEDELRARLARLFGPAIEVRVMDVPRYPPPTQPSDWLPRTFDDGLSWHLAAAPGRLARDGECLYLENDAARVLLIFPRPREIASFDDQSNTLTLYGETFAVGTRLTFGGSGGEGALPDRLVVPPDPRCDARMWWRVGGPASKD
jgi:hypothetical protein